jgi:hypothetical protein
LGALSRRISKTIETVFDGDRLSSDGGALLIAEILMRLGFTKRLAVFFPDSRRSARIRHTIESMMSFRVLMIACGYQDCNDATKLRDDPVFKLALEKLDVDEELCSQPTLSRFENAPDAECLERMKAEMIEIYCQSYRQVPERIVLDIDDTFDEAYGEQQLAFFNGYYDGSGFSPMVIFDETGRVVLALLRPARTPTGQEIAGVVKMVLAHIRSCWPRVQITLRGDSHYGCHEVFELCREMNVDYIFGLGTNQVLQEHAVDAVDAAKALYKQIPATQIAKGEKARKFDEFAYRANSWEQPERVITRVETGEMGTDLRFIVTSLKIPSAKYLYEAVYCRRGNMENHIKAFKNHIFADRTSCSKATANQFRLILHMVAYWMMWHLRELTPKRSPWYRAQFDTLRLTFIKIGTWVRVTADKIIIHWPENYPHQGVLRFIAARIPRVNC